MNAIRILRDVAVGGDTLERAGDPAAGRAVLRMTGLRKRYPGALALGWRAEDSLTITAGEIHGIVGENGAGKSTLFGVLAGLQSPSAGTLALAGEPYAPMTVTAARRAGVEIVMQEPGLVGALTVAENFFLGRSEDASAGLVRRRRSIAVVREALDRIAPRISPRALASSLSLSEQKLVELARAVHFGPRLLLVDEMSACLDHADLRVLFEVLRAQRDAGCAVLYISHHLEEVGDLCDRVSVLKDGQLVATLPIDEAEPDRLSTLMVGRAIASELYPTATGRRGTREPLFEARNLTVRGEFAQLSFAVKPGEIVGIGGLVGCGSDALAHVIFGHARPTAGEMTLSGRAYVPRGPRQAIANGVAYVPSDRDREGLLLRLPIATNATLARLPKLSRAGIYAGRREPRLVRALIERLAIACRGPGELPLNLSGGNRQKVVLAKWLLTEPDLFVLHNPTRGVDIGAKTELYAQMRRLADDGAGIVLITEELPELLGMSDRILIMRRGRISHTTTRDQHPSEHELIVRMV